MMTETTTTEMQAQVVRYNVAKVSVVRNAVPLVMLVTIGGKYIGIYALALALLLQLSVVVLYLRARQNFGRQSIKAKPDTVAITGLEERVRRQTTSGWVFSERSARVYGSKYSYRFKVAAAESEQLRNILTHALGPHIETRPRGSSRVRMVALAVAIVGVAALAAGIVCEALPIGLLGLVALLVGSATYGVLSQRVAKAGPSER